MQNHHVQSFEQNHQSIHYPTPFIKFNLMKCTLNKTVIQPQICNSVIQPKICNTVQQNEFFN